MLLLRGGFLLTLALGLAQAFVRVPGPQVIQALIRVALMDIAALL